MQMDRVLTQADHIFLFMLKTVCEHMFGDERSVEYYRITVLFLHIIRRNAYDDGHIISLEQAYRFMGSNPNLLSHFRIRN